MKHSSVALDHLNIVTVIMPTNSPTNSREYNFLLKSITINVRHASHEAVQGEQTHSAVR